MVDRISPSVADARRLLRPLGLAVSLQAALVIGHFAHGAQVFDDPSRYHVVAPALVALALSGLVGAVYAWRPSPAALWAMVVVVAVPFVGLFGLYHGGYNHLLKLAVYAAGASPERLEDIFDSPDFAPPSDFVFEATGVATLLVASVIAYILFRLVRAAGRPDPTTTRAAASGNA